MSYIDPSQYNQLLKNFAKGTPKQILSENYIDLRPVGSMEEKADKESGIGMRSVKAGIDSNPKVTRADFIPAAKKDEGMHLGQPTEPTIQTVEGMSLGNLSLDERNALKTYVESIKTTKKAIQELLEKAKTPKMESGNNTELEIVTGQQAQQQTGTPEEETPEEEQY